MSTVSRRSLLKGLGLAGLSATTLPGLLAMSPTSAAPRGLPFDPDAPVDAEAFPSGVASGDPTPSGAIAWTRVAPDVVGALPPAARLQLVVARDQGLREVVARRVVGRDELLARARERDGTVRVELDGLLPTADSVYYYRWYVGERASRLGRLRTAPAPGSMPDGLRFGVFSCSNYPAGFFNAYGAALGDDLDYVVHVGDFLYENRSVGNANGRDVELPSGASDMSTLEDCYAVHRTYRSDPHLQDLLAWHTLIATWDDHETVNNPWYDYAAASHDSGSHAMPQGSHDYFRRYFLEAATAYHDWIPNRTFLDEVAVRERVLAPDAPETQEVSPQDAFRLYRHVAFGDLLDLLMVDGRWYRTRQLGAQDMLAGTSDASTTQGEGVEEPSSTMLGLEQARWLAGELRDSTAVWRVLGNQTVFTQLGIMLPGPATVHLNMDAWDGYRAERDLLLDAMAGQGNNIVLTGDMHAFVWGYVQDAYGVEGEVAGRRVAYEVMTSSVTSTGLFFAAAPDDDTTVPGVEEALEAATLAANPHLDLFNWTRHGYVVLEVTPTHVDATAYLTGIGSFEERPRAVPYFGVRVHSDPGGEVVASVRFRNSPSGLPLPQVGRPRPQDAFALPTPGQEPVLVSSWGEVEALLGDPAQLPQRVLRARAERAGTTVPAAADLLG